MTQLSKTLERVITIEVVGTMETDKRVATPIPFVY